MLGACCLVLAGIFLPAIMPANAALVQCSTQEFPQACTLCDLMQLFNRVIYFTAFKFTPIFASLMFVIAGFMIILAGANPENVNKGREMFKLTIIGVVIIYAAFLITNTIIQTIAGDNKVAGSWFSLECKNPAELAGPPAPGGLGGGGTGSGNYAPGTLSREDATRQLEAAGILIKTGPSGADVGGLRQSTVNETIRLKKDCACSVFVNEGTAFHADDSAHGQGYKVDIKPDQALNNYIQQTSNFREIPLSQCGNGAASACYVRKDNSNIIYARESSHWDVYVR